ncbi:hypothetical protein SELMODRAFT_451525 [Selaginella moellendorffii]|uniref:Uncharacterized protein n=1 Tax=Selaginella moellendorffii TaxID=88036 RepID=D8RV43_SELML|nr:uncharacterized protein LOC9628777 [Selaginella moellendorffii]EFJ23709.1 hypothetical protein SELMODRAFT_451525 [Selaginella moellendorffii]|eukprot:XP_002974924.1 uncharacterized protein LOC9628777 [Selaginella moellendorffii]
MGNCQASDAVATLIEYPNGRMERLYWTISARQVMLQNPGYYVAVYVWPKPSSSPKRKPKMKILPPSAILATGNCYRLISFEEVLNNFSSRKIGTSRVSGMVDAAFLTAPDSSKSGTGSQFQTFPDARELGMGMSIAKPWRPSLKSIAETM